MNKEILCTLGPASMNPTVIKRLEELNVSLFRINLSHTKAEDLPAVIEKVQSATNVPLCLDTEGAQVRTGDIATPITLRENSTIRAPRALVPGTSERFNFYPASVVDDLRVGDFISIDFNSVLGQVTEIDAAGIVLRIINGGKVGSNKAVTVLRDIPLPVLTDKDRACIEIGNRMGIMNFALSFANRASDVEEMRGLVKDGARIISKIECLNALTNLEAIAQASDALLIDRGDLSRQVAIERIPEVQKEILKRGRAAGVKVYVATNLLESMVAAPMPTRAEVNDIYNTLLDGADGLVLAAETAIGAYPIQCAQMVVNLIGRYEKRVAEPVLHLDNLDSAASNLIPPHGGTLVKQVATDADIAAMTGLPAITLPSTDIMDCEQIALGTYSPITGFMGQAALESVLATNRLPNGTVWTLPIVLAIDAEKAKGLSTGMRVRLTTGTGATHSLMDVEEIYKPDLENVAERWFGTRSTDHPGVKRLLDSGDTFIAGPITLVERAPSEFRAFELTPEESRYIFNHKGWSQVVGFHGRNPAHCAHEYIQKTALERTHADGLYISPVIGPKKKHDFMTGAILGSYELLIDSGAYPENRTVLGAFATYSRYSGPREAVFTALCRKNMGCSHFIIGRDHTGVGTFYAPDANIRMFDQLGDIGIRPVFFDNVGFDPEKQALVEGATGTVSISGTEVREKFRAGEHVPEWFMRRNVQDYILGLIAAGETVFHD